MSRLREKNEPLPREMREAPARVTFDPDTLTFSDARLTRELKNGPRIVSLIAVCDTCGRWQETPVCPPEDVVTEMEILGWRDGECPICAREEIPKTRGRP